MITYKPNTTTTKATTARQAGAGNPKPRLARLTRVMAAAAFGLLVSSASGADFFNAAGVSGVTLGTARGGTQTFAASGSTPWNWAAISQGAMGVTNNTGDFSTAIKGDVGAMGSFTLTYGNVRRLMQMTGQARNLSGNGTNVANYLTGGFYQSATYNGYLTTAWNNAVTAASQAAAKTNNPSGTNSLFIRTGATTATYSPAASTAFSTATITSSNQAVGFYTSAAGTTRLGTTAPATGATYVIRLNDLILTGAGAVLTLAGNGVGTVANTVNYIINIKNSLTLSGGAQVALSGGLTSQNVLFHVGNAATSTIGLSGGAVLNGIILAPTRAFGESGASKVYGQVIAKTINLSGSSKIINPVVSP